MIDRETLPYRTCVGMMLINKDGLVFIGRRAGGIEHVDDSHVWQMPQGGLNQGEKPEDAARRELEEETGVRSIRIIARTRDWLTYDIPDELLGIAWEGRYRGQKQMWFAARFEGPESEIDLSPRKDHEQEFDAWRWATLAELPALVVPFKRDVYERVIRELAPLLD